MTKKSMPIEELVELYYGEEMASLRELGAIEGVNKTTIKRRLERNGYTLRGPGRVPGRKSKLPMSLNEKAQAMKNKYGMTPEDYSKMYNEQLGGCAICGKGIPSTWKTGVHIDHDHKTGKVRGLLCHKCNLGLGNFNDNTNTLMSACEYLDRPR